MMLWKQTWPFGSRSIPKWGVADASLQPPKNFAGLHESRDAYHDGSIAPEANSNPKGRRVFFEKESNSIRNKSVYHITSERVGTKSTKESQTFT